MSAGQPSVRRSLAAVAALLAALLPGPQRPSLQAQHETAFDIEDGGRAFQNMCANCHGPDGNAVAGVDLGGGQFRRASSDEALVRIILNGIPNTPMPPSVMAPEQAARIVAYLRSVAASKRTTSARGDPVRGRALFEGRGGCTGCHRVAGSGSPGGPDLSRIGQMRRAAQLEQSLLEPDAEVLPVNRTYRVVTRDGTATTGRLLNQDTFTVQLLDAHASLRSFDKTSLRDHGFTPTPMPSFRGTFTSQETADVVSYLVSLRGAR